MGSNELKEQVIKKLSDREHILLRSGMYLGSSTLEKKNQYVIENNKFVLKELEYVPGLIKIFNELIDNSLDEHVRTKGKHSTNIQIEITSDKFTIKDNGRGIPVKLAHDDKYMPEVAWTEARAGSNFEDAKSSTIGTNGVGSMIASVFSKKFIGTSDDGKNKIKVQCLNNNEEINSTLYKSTSPGVQVEIYPDLERFGLTEITQVHIDVIEQRIYNLSVAYPGIKFKFNKKNIKIKTKDYLNMFSEDPKDIEIIEEEKYSFAFMNSKTDDFQQFSMMNGLLLSQGGKHVKHLTDNVVNRLRDKLIKKYKTIKPGDIRNKLFLISVLRDFGGPVYSSQTKEELTNDTKEIQEYFGEINYDKIVNRILKNPAIIDPITDYYKIKEEMKNRQNLKKLKTTKKIKSEKYLPATRKKKILFLCEGDCLGENTEILMSDYSTKKIKDIDIGDEVISEDLTKEVVKAKTKLLKETITFKTNNNSIICGKNHKMKVYNKTTKTFMFVKATEIKENTNNFMFVKSKINKDTEAVKVISNKDNKMTTNFGTISYTSDDYFVIIRDSYVFRIHALDIEPDDLVLMA